MPLGFPYFRSISDDDQVKIVYKQRRESVRQRTSLLRNETASKPVTRRSANPMSKSDQHQYSPQLRQVRAPMACPGELKDWKYASNDAYRPKTRSVNSSHL
jgi:hypothetical protein